MNISLLNEKCPDCGGTNCVKYTGKFCGIVFGCADCGNSFMTMANDIKAAFPDTKEQAAEKFLTAIT